MHKQEHSVFKQQEKLAPPLFRRTICVKGLPEMPRTCPSSLWLTPVGCSRAAVPPSETTKMSLSTQVESRLHL